MSFKEKSIKELETIQKELNKELNTKREEEKRKVNEVKAIRTMALIKAAAENPLVLELFPHGRNSCTDSLNNAHFRSEYKSAECNRCLFEEMVRDYKDSFNKDDFQPSYLIDLEISFEENF